MALSIEQQRKRVNHIRAQDFQNEQCLNALHTVQSLLDWMPFTPWRLLTKASAYCQLEERGGQDVFMVLRSYHEVSCIAWYCRDHKRIIFYDLMRWNFLLPPVTAVQIARFRSMVLRMFPDADKTVTHTMRPV